MARGSPGGSHPEGQVGQASALWPHWEEAVGARLPAGAQRSQPSEAGQGVLFPEGRAPTEQGV